jgi:hypothetical protein
MDSLSCLSLIDFVLYRLGIPLGLFGVRILIFYRPHLGYLDLIGYGLLLFPVPLFGLLELLHRPLKGFHMIPLGTPLGPFQSPLGSF